MSRKASVFVLFFALFVVSMVAGRESESTLVEENSRSISLDRNRLDVYFFYGQGCSHCANVEPFLVEMERKYPLQLHRFDIYNNRSSLSLFDNYSSMYGLPLDQRAVPTVFVSETYLVGDSPILDGFEEVVKKTLKESSAAEQALDLEVGNQQIAPAGGGLSIVTVTLAALVNSVGPCSIAILVFLVGARVLVANRRKRALKVGLAFCLSVFIAYFLFGLGLLTVVQLSGFSNVFSLLVGLVAVLTGLFYLKDVFWYGSSGFVMEVPRSLKPLLMKMLKGVTSPLGAFLMGFVVCCFELPCTGGPYLFILGQLANNATRLQAIPLLLYYNLLFVLPLIMISLILYSGFFSVERIRQWNDRNKRLLRLVGGLTVMILGFLVIPVSQILQFIQMFLHSFKVIGLPVLGIMLFYLVLSFAKRKNLWGRLMRLPGRAILLLSLFTAAMFIVPTPAARLGGLESESGSCVTCGYGRSADTGALGYGSLASSGAPGYCPSTGGSTEYEYISDVEYETKAGIMIITIFVWIANPTGCVPAEPCPEYDASPEYVNAWIDWDGDKVWEEGERVLDAALTGYQAINYHGWMTVSALVTIPPYASETTWMRVNLGWGYDPNNPCEEYWTWGNVFDKEVEVKLPKIKEIIVTGIPDAKNPTTNDPSTAVVEKVKLEAEITPAEGFEVTKVSWSGEIKSGEGNPYEYEAAPDTHGKKKVECTITFKHKVTGAIGTDKKTKEFMLFFVKDGDEDSDGIPNWFEYWIKLNVGDRHGVTDIKYDGTMVGADGKYSWGTTSVRIGPGASGKDQKPPGTNIIGIDNFAQTLTHECLHYHHWNTWWKGKNPTDTDHDELPDWYEDVGDDGLPNTGDAHELDGIFNGAEIYDVTKEKTPGNPWADDEEWVTHKETDNNRGTHDQDWANPGKQTTPPEPDPPTTSEEREPKWVPLPSPPATFNGIYSDHGADTDGDGLYNYLAVEVGVNVTISGIYLIAGGLEDGKGNVVWTNNMTNLNAGDQSVTLNFDGLSIRQRRVNGPYNLVLLNLYNESDVLIDYVDEAYTTSTYDYAEFQLHAEGGLSGCYSDYGTDTDGDGLYNYLTVEVGVNMTVAGDYTVGGWLYDSNGNDILIATNSTYLNAGSQSVTLNFDGLSIHWHRTNGPYNLRYLSLSGSDQIDFIYDAYNTSAYSYTDFQKTNAGFSGSYSDYGKDIDSDGLYNYLTLGVMIDIATSGNYTLTGLLYDSNGTEIVGSSNRTHLNSGSRLVLLDFDGKAIYKHGVDGPYDLRYLTLHDENGTLMDTLNYAYTTSAYNYTDFQYLVLLTGVYSDYGTDIDGDGLYNYLTVDIGAKVAADGNCFIYARLMDINETEIVWASNVTFLYANQTQTIQLNFNGTYIYENMVDGPYYVRDVYIYHQGDPTQSDYVYDAYPTNAYSYTDFQHEPHDVAVVDVTPSKTVVCQGFSLNINVTAANQGDYTETFNVTVYANETIIDTLLDITLTKGNSTILTFTWNTAGFVIGNYTISANATLVPGETEISDNTYINGEVKVRQPIHDVTVLSVTPNKSMVSQGFSVDVSVIAENLGDVVETFNVTAYANTTVIGKQEVTLASGNSTTLMFTWDTTGFAFGDYPIKAIADMVPEETNTDDNTYEDGVVKVVPYHDVAVTEALLYGYDTWGTLYIQVTVVNEGNYTETINVHLDFTMKNWMSFNHAGIIIVEQEQQIILDAKTSGTLVFSFNSYGSYGLSQLQSKADKAHTYELDLTDNTLTFYYYFTRPHLGYRALLK